MNEAAPHQGRYVDWLVEQSMLNDASAAAGQLATVGGMVQNPFGVPDPVRAIEKAPVWFTAYPVSMVTKPGESFLETLCDDALWEAFEILGIAAVHTGPVKRAGGISGWDVTPSVDGQFDRISTHIDEAFGTEQEFRRLCEVAAGHGGIVIDDIVPGHTGKGADFRLAEMNVGDYPGIYHMAEIPRAALGVAARGSDRPGLRQSGTGDRGAAGAGRVHRRPAAAGDLPRSGDQGHQLECDRAGDRCGRCATTLGLPALLQGRSAVDQLAGPDIRRHAAGGGRCAALAQPPGGRRVAARRQRVFGPRAGRRRG